ncbi:FAD-dependent oxidoreductase, partial [Christiangramia aquimixticola]
TGWVSNTLFEPSVGNQILQRITSQVPNLEIFLEAEWKSATYQNELWEVIAIQNGKELRFSSSILIDATELGDVAASQGLPYRLGMDARAETREEFAP